MRTNIAILVSLLLATVLVCGSVGVALAEECPKLTLTPARQVSADELAGSTHKLYVEPGGKGWVIFFKTAEVAANSELGNFNGVWLNDEKSSTVKVFRFDTEEGVAFSLFTAENIKGYVIGYRTAQKAPWRFLLPEKACPNPTITVAALRNMP
jgi:hypothetical protein